MILIIDGTGSLGTAVTRRLLTQGQAVRIMTRTPAKAQALQNLGAEIIQGDLRDADSLATACQGADSVLAAAHSIMGRGSEASKYIDERGHKWLIDAVKAAGVRRFVYVSVREASPHSAVPFFRIKYAVEQYLRASGLEFVILRPAAFMESHAHMLIGQPILEKGKVSLFGKGKNPRNFVAADDVAHFAVIALNEPQAAGQIISVDGPEDLTNMQVVALYEAVADCNAKVSHVPLGILRVMSVLLRPLHPGLSQIMQLSILEDTTDQTFDMRATLQKYPMTLTRLEDWVRQHIPDEAVTAARLA